ncbi:MAG TPA: M23 family metallopeptidase [Gemmatimonadaceae bacterium]|nr:M23 family metallopeptidase [Gemmatimonadaceae bacterium]
MHSSRLLLPLGLLAAACAPASRVAPRLAPLPEPPAESPLFPAGELSAGAAPSKGVDFDALRARGMMVPVAGVSPSQLTDTYHAPRDGGRRHAALDILAPRGTAVLAADNGVIVRVGTNTLGGNVIWATDGERRFAYYYAHLDRYARGLREGQVVNRGEVIGYVGTTGNAPAGTPHLHFQVMRLLDARRFSDGLPFNPLPFFSSPGVTR